MNISELNPAQQVSRTGSETLPELAGGTPALQAERTIAANRIK